MHSVWLKAKLGCERAQRMTERLLATKALLDQLTESMQQGRARRQQVSAKLEATQAVIPKEFAPPRFSVSNRS